MKPDHRTASDIAADNARYLRLVHQRCELNRQLAAVAVELEPLEAMLQLRLAAAGSRPLPGLADGAPPGGQHLTVPDVCNRFSRSWNCIYRWVRDGRIKPIKGADRPYLFHQDEIERFEYGFRRLRS